MINQNNPIMSHYIKLPWHAWAFRAFCSIWRPRIQRKINAETFWGGTTHRSERNEALQGRGL